MAEPQAAIEDVFEPIRAIIHRMNAQSYAEGYRRAVHLIAIGVGKIDGEGKESMAKTLDMLGEELHAAEEAAK